MIRRIAENIYPYRNREKEMINKKNVLGMVPTELGAKDAVHTAIVAVRAAEPLRRGERCTLNEDREAKRDPKGPGIVDPWRELVGRGDVFWMVLNGTEVPSVRHHWEHPDLDFSPPTKEPETNKYLEQMAKTLDVTVELLMEACASVVKYDKSLDYTGKLDEDELDDVLRDVFWDIWYEWSEETGHEFENMGSACCPEYDYPETPLFVIREP